MLHAHQDLVDLIVALPMLPDQARNLVRDLVVDMSGDVVEIVEDLDDIGLQAVSVAGKGVSQTLLQNPITQRRL
jgi:hypothetical protein